MLAGHLHVDPTDNAAPAAADAHQAEDPVTPVHRQVVRGIQGRGAVDWWPAEPELPLSVLATVTCGNTPHRDNVVFNVFVANGESAERVREKIRHIVIVRFPSHFHCPTRFTDQYNRDLNDSAVFHIRDSYIVIDNTGRDVEFVKYEF